MSENYIPLSQITHLCILSAPGFTTNRLEGHQVVNEHVEEGKGKEGKMEGIRLEEWKQKHWKNGRMGGA